jgi:hypothetical protein
MIRRRWRPDVGADASTMKCERPGDWFILAFAAPTIYRSSPEISRLRVSARSRFVWFWLRRTRAHRPRDDRVNPRLSGADSPTPDWQADVDLYCISDLRKFITPLSPMCPNGKAEFGELACDAAALAELSP